MESLAVRRAAEPGNRDQPRIVVYTAMFGQYDTLQEPRVRTDRCDFVCFTDNPALQSRTWTIMALPAPPDPAMMNRYVKLHPQLYVPQYEISIYIDPNVRLRRDPAELVDKYLQDGGTFAAPRHQSRNCVYDEIEACIEVGKIDAAAGRAQAARYRDEGYPAHYGLSENRVLIRRHRDPAVRALMESWWAELTSGVRRDQASLQVVCWRAGFQIRYMAEDTVCGRYFLYRPHRHERLVFRVKLAVLILLKRLSGPARRLFGARRAA